VAHGCCGFFHPARKTNFPNKYFSEIIFQHILLCKHTNQPRLANNTHEETAMTAVALFGAGRIGKIHAANLAAQPGARLKYVVDTHQPSAQELAAQYGASVSDIDSALADPEVGAVVIASSTDTHADLILRAARMARPSSAKSRWT
jgi:glutamyl-tRNA reductase